LNQQHGHVLMPQRYTGSDPGAARVQVLVHALRGESVSSWLLPRRQYYPVMLSVLYADV
jgi:hypothetical protein